jgi:hypothetical protein
VIIGKIERRLETSTRQCYFDLPFHRQIRNSIGGKAELVKRVAIEQQETMPTNAPALLPHLRFFVIPTNVRIALRIVVKRVIVIVFVVRRDRIIISCV